MHIAAGESHLRRHSSQHTQRHQSGKRELIPDRCGPVQCRQSAVGSYPIQQGTHHVVVPGNLAGGDDVSQRPVVYMELVKVRDGPPVAGMPSHLRPDQICVEVLVPRTLVHRGKCQPMPCEYVLSSLEFRVAKRLDVPGYVEGLDAKAAVMCNSGIQQAGIRTDDRHEADRHLRSLPSFSLPRNKAESTGHFRIMLTVKSTVAQEEYFGY